MFSVVGEDNELVAQYPEKEFPQLADVCQRVVAQIPLNEVGRRVFEEDNYRFHCKV
jgi:hypothetical protein